MSVAREDCRAEVDQIDRSTWHQLLPAFSDATIYQTRSYGAGRWGENALSHLALRQGNQIVALAQCVIRRTPFVSCGLAYVPCGPIWRGVSEDPEVFRLIVRALREEYAVRRRLLLRLAPPEIDTPEGDLKGILQAEGFTRTARQYRTLLIDLAVPLDQLRKGMSERWRRALKKAESLKLEVCEGTGEELYRAFKGIYRDMVARKGFVPSIDIDEFEWIQKDLPDSLKMRIMICRHGEQPVASLIASLIGKTGIGLIGGTATEGLKSGGFHLLNLRMMKWMQESGAAYYDFGGYEPEQNSGTAAFKAAIPGRDVCHIGQFEACANRLSGIGVGLADRLRGLATSIKAKAYRQVRAIVSPKG